MISTHLCELWTKVVEEEKVYFGENTKILNYGKYAWAFFGTCVMSPGAKKVFIVHIVEQ